MNSAFKSSRIKEFLIVLLIFVFSFWLRLAFISKGPFHFDTVLQAQLASDSLLSLRLHYHRAFGYPLTIILSAIFIFVFRLLGIVDPILSVNFLSVFISSVDVVIFYFLVKNLINARCALFSSLIFSLFPAFLSVSTFGNSHCLSIMFVLLSVNQLVIYTKNYRLKNLVYCGLFLGLQGLSRPQDTLIILPVSLIFFVCHRDLKKGRLCFDKSVLMRYLLFLALICLPLIFYIYMIFTTGTTQSLYLLRQANYLGPISRMLATSARYTVYMFTYVSFIISFVGMATLFKYQRRVFFFLVIWFLSLYLFYGNLANFDARYLILAVLPLIVYEGYELSRLFTQNRVACSLLFAFILLNMFLVMYPVLKLRHEYCLQEEFAKLVAAKTADTSLIIAQDERLFLGYYTERHSIIAPVTCNRKEIRQFLVDEIDNQLSKKNEVYIVDSTFAYDHCGLLEREISKKYKIDTVASCINETWHHTTVVPYLFTQDLILGNKSLYSSFYAERLYKITKKVTAKNAK
ncbi:MAG: glycosyltransferase family 39 protein [Candidatus Omnitrophota bacterium]